MNRIPKHLAQRINRLARRAHAFHRFAHHPLCEAYACEVLRFGRLRLCKGCALVALGGLSGVLVSGVFPVLSPKVLIVIAGLSLAWVWMVFAWAWPRRIGKLGTRGLPSLMAGFLLIQGLRNAGLVGLTLATGAFLALPVAMLAYRRHGPWRGPCATCPERELRPCSGFRPQLRRERAFRRLAGRLLDSLTPPDPRGL